MLSGAHLVHRLAEVSGDVEAIEADELFCALDHLGDRIDVGLPHIHRPDARGRKWRIHAEKCASWVNSSWRRLLNVSGYFFHYRQDRTTTDVRAREPRCDPAEHLVS